jgi:uncharacterized membrane protein (DUF2068 family)
MRWRIRQERGLQLIALFEAAKGGIVLAIGLGLLSLLHHDAQDIAERLVACLHLNPDSYYPRVFIDGVGKLDDGKLWFIAALAFLYAVFRFVEAYGLWRMRAWAEWIALISGSAYLPIEVYELTKGVTWTRALALLINAVVVVYLAAIVTNNQRHTAAPPLKS